MVKRPSVVDFSAEKLLQLIEHATRLSKVMLAARGLMR
jgi:hypothetical protein